MRMAGIVTVATVMGLAAVSPAGAQEQRTVGITMGYPASIGVLWRVSDKVAIRPELSFAGGQSDVALSSFVSETDGWSAGTGVSALFYLHKYEHLRTYVSPRFTYGHSTSTVTNSAFTVSKTTNDNSSTGAGGSFGAQYSLGDRFAVFGELGFAFSHRTSSTNTTATKIGGKAWGTQSAVGVVFFP